MDSIAERIGKVCRLSRTVGHIICTVSKLNSGAYDIKGRCTETAQNGHGGGERLV